MHHSRLHHTAMRVRTCLVVLSILLPPTGAQAYKIIAPPVHESMTLDAKACFDNAQPRGQAPDRCPLSRDPDQAVDSDWKRDSSTPIYNVPEKVGKLVNLLPDFPNLEEAVKWPDDPTREISAGILEYGTQMLLDRCAGKRDEKTGRITLDAGLLCASHFGDLQFLHAQASRTGEPALETHEKIVNWASFLFLVASGQISDEQLDQNYCEYFTGPGAFNEAMAPGPNAKPCAGDDAWRLTTLFNINCANPLPMVVGCSEQDGEGRFDTARIIATGALLHLLQDAYSQSHVIRGGCEEKNGSVVAKVECLPVTAFTAYQHQSHHGEADQRPEFAESCRSAESWIDPVTAGARMLWFVQQQASLSVFRQQMIYQVFGEPGFIRQLAEASRPGQCFSE